MRRPRGTHAAPRHPEADEMIALAHIMSARDGDAFDSQAFAIC